MIHHRIRGGVGVNHNILAEFPVDNGSLLDRLMTSTLKREIDDDPSVAEDRQKRRRLTGHR